MSPKVNIVAQLEFELAYYEAAVDDFSYYVTWTHMFPLIIIIIIAISSLLASFSYHYKLIVVHRSLSDSISPQVPCTLL